MKKLIIFVFIFLILVVPVLSLAQTKLPPLSTYKGGGIVPCNNTPDKDGKIALPCDFKALLTLVNNVIRFVLFYMAIPIAAILMAYAGIKLVISGGSSEARGKARSIFTNAVIGLALAAGAWLIIRTILSILGYKGDWIGF